MAKKQAENERIFAGSLKQGHKILCDDGKYRTVVKVDPILDPSKPNFTSNEVIAYIEYEKTIKQEIKSDSVVIQTSQQKKLSVNKEQ